LNLLALETSAKAASCAVMLGDALTAHSWQCAGLTHSRTLMPMVEDMLKNAGVGLRELDAVAVAAGPGSFTGLRIGAATAKGLAWAAEKPCIPVSTLEAMAWPLAHMDALVLCAMDARRQQIYSAAFRCGDGAPRRLWPDRAVSLDEAASGLEKLGESCVLVGDGAELCYSFLSLRGLPCRLAPAHLRSQSAVGVAMAAQAAGMDAAVSPQDLRPVYLRLSQAERERLERLGHTAAPAT